MGRGHTVDGYALLPCVYSYQCAGQVLTVGWVCAESEISAVVAKSHVRPADA